jgi:hypothetical protein
LESGSINETSNNVLDMYYGGNVLLGDYRNIQFMSAKGEGEEIPWPINGKEIVQTVIVYPVLSGTTIFQTSILGLIWLLVTFLPAIVLNEFIPRIGFVSGILIMTIVLGLMMENYFFITIIAIIGCAFLVLRGD